MATNAECVPGAMVRVARSKRDMVGWMGIVQELTQAHAIYIAVHHRFVEEPVVVELLGGGTLYTAAANLEVVTRVPAAHPRQEGS
jgi:hypothetical protein